MKANDALLAALRVHGDDGVSLKRGRHGISKATKKRSREDCRPVLRIAGKASECLGWRTRRQAGQVRSQPQTSSSPQRLRQDAREWPPAGTLRLENRREALPLQRLARYLKESAVTEPWAKNVTGDHSAATERVTPVSFQSAPLSARALNQKVPKAALAKQTKEKAHVLSEQVLLLGQPLPTGLLRIRESRTRMFSSMHTLRGLAAKVYQRNLLSDKKLQPAGRTCRDSGGSR